MFDGGLGLEDAKGGCRASSLSLDCVHMLTYTHAHMQTHDGSVVVVSWQQSAVWGEGRRGYEIINGMDPHNKELTSICQRSPDHNNAWH